MRRNEEPTSPANDMSESNSPFVPPCAATAPNGVANAFPEQNLQKSIWLTFVKSNIIPREPNHPTHSMDACIFLNLC